MMKVLEYLNGKKAYITAAVTFALGGAQALGYPIPDYVWTILAAAGLGSLRSAVKKGEI